MSNWISGSLVRTIATFKDVNGNAADPTNITLKYTKDNGAPTVVNYPNPPMVRDNVGVYHVDLDTSGWTSPVNQAWVLEWIGAGAVQAINQDYWFITAPVI